MKKIVAVLLTLVLLIGAFAGCQKQDKDADKGKISWITASGDSAFNGGEQNDASQDETSSETENSSSQSSASGNESITSSSNASSNNSSITSSNSGNTSSGNSSNASSNASSNNSSNTSSNASSNTSSNTSSNVSSTPAEEPEEDVIKDISGSGITQDGVETILKTTAITNEFITPTFTRLTYTHSSGKKMCYSVRLPANYDENEKYPVLMFLHGIKQSGSDWNSIIHLASLYKYNADIVNKAIVVSPQAPTVDLWQMTNNGTGAMAYSLLTKVIEKNYSVDMNRIYLVGLSMGGMGTWGMLEAYPDHFAASSPICGTGTPSKANVLKNIPIWCWHGTADTTVGYNWDGATPKMYDAIKRAGGDKIIFTKLQGEGHNAWDPAFSSRAHLSWLFSQVKGGHQSTEYTVVPYLTVRDSNGNVIISEKDAVSVEARDGSGKVANKKDIVLTLSKEATQKLSSAYQKSGGKEFKIYFGNKEIVTFKATQKTTGRILVIRDVFPRAGYNDYYSKLLTTVGKN